MGAGTKQWQVVRICIHDYRHLYYSYCRHQLRKSCYCKSICQGQGDRCEKGGRCLPLLIGEAISYWINYYLCTRLCHCRSCRTAIVASCKYSYIKAINDFRQSIRAKLYAAFRSVSWYRRRHFSCHLFVIVQAHYCFERTKAKWKGDTWTSKSVGRSAIHHLDRIDHRRADHFPTNAFHSVGKTRTE